MREMVGGCCVCSDDRGWSENPLVYCDGQNCTVAVHQACYGIVTVPTGPWYCRKCESQERSAKVKCELCPSKYGALKRTDNSGWAHVVCALYIPEVRFGNVTTMEPIQLQLIPAERFNKTCYICEEKAKPTSASVGACMQCNKIGCKQQFHVTCAQGLGLLCEEAGNYLDNVKYCGYCQHHYSKLKKGGNVKTIPPYKPVANESHLSDSKSDSEEVDPGGGGGTAKSAAIASTSTASTSSAQPQPPTSTSSTTPPTSTSSSKRKASSSSKASSKASSSTSSGRTSSSSSHPKTVHNSSSSSRSQSSAASDSKPNKVANSSARSGSNKSGATSSAEDSASADAPKTDTKDSKSVSEAAEPAKADLSPSKVIAAKDPTPTVATKSSKKRKSNSRTPTPVAPVVPPSESVSVVTPTPGAVPEPPSDRKVVVSDSVDKPKKAKVETTQSILTNQPVVALTSLSTIKSLTLSSSSSSAAASAATAIADSGPEPLPPSVPAVPTQQSSIIQSSHVNSLLVSVPLASTSLSPHHAQMVNNQTSVLTPTPHFLGGDRGSHSTPTPDRRTPNSPSVVMTGGSGSQSGAIVSPDMSDGGLKIVYEKQDAVTTEVDMELEVSPTVDETSSKRSHSVEKLEKVGRGKKKNANANGLISQLNNATISGKRSSRSQTSSLATSPQPGAFSSISQSQMKDSPPSSPSSESQGGNSTTSRGRAKTRKSAPATMTNPTSPKDVKLFQNGVTAPHMLGNQLNPNSNMAQKMSDHLNSELEAHSIFTPNDNSNLIGPQLHHRVIASARASSTGGSSTASGGSGLSSMLGGGGGNIPQTLDQLLERQWEQGSQFLMEQAQHFDIASLLSCLHQLRAENLRLEEHVSSLLQRRDHLLAVNARLAIPLTGQPATPQSSHPHTVNNIHPAVGASHGEIPRPPRHGNGSGSNSSYPSHPQGSQHAGGGMVVENGLPSDQSQYPPHSHRSPVTTQSQPSPSIRHSPVGSGYPSSGLLRQSADTSGRSAPRPQQYPLYQGPGPSSQQQMVIRRDSDVYHQPSSKPS